MLINFGRKNYLLMPALCFSIILISLLGVIPESSAQTKSPNIRRIKIRQYMKKAKSYRDIGRMEQARALFLIAISIDPTIKRPVWLDEAPKPKSLLPKSETEKINQISELPYEKAKPKLSLILKNDPSNSQARRALLLLAKKKGDKQEITRHSSALNPNSFLFSQIEKLLLTIFLICLILWQANKLFKLQKLADKERMTQKGVVQ